MKKILPWTAVILWMALIFYLSHQPATVSNDLSTGITEVIVETVEKVAPNMEFDIGAFNHLVRKNAHFIAYFILGILVMNALRYSHLPLLRKVGLALLICILYAISDEVHQIFIPGRSGEVRDVLIDTAGASVGIGLYLAVGRLFGRWGNRSS
ncbi:VanZ family protein [Alkalihalobacterium elongatum]|uniref:VanZ family protein n=1 Tax=Alkalihalobacterium elongatum TaxID=2675466 RepID=UPI001C1F4F64|nr:VanZ family protein [Alkalihalobacterium elongatum]